jgi:hypothetical protein
MKIQNKLERLSLGKFFQPGLIFAGKARSLPQSEEPLKYSTWARSCLTWKYFTWIDILARNTLAYFVILLWRKKKFYNIDPMVIVIR